MTHPPVRRSVGPPRCRRQELSTLTERRVAFAVDESLTEVHEWRSRVGVKEYRHDHDHNGRALDGFCLDHVYDRISKRHRTSKAELQQGARVTRCFFFSPLLPLLVLDVTMPFWCELQCSCLAAVHSELSPPAGPCVHQRHGELQGSNMQGSCRRRRAHAVAAGLEASKAMRH